MREVAVPALLSALALWSAFPPLGWYLLAWFAPLGWLTVIDRERSPGKWGYVWLWVAGAAFWLAILQGIRLAFWVLIFGWIAMSLWLALAIPLFVGIARILRHQWRWPLVFAAPVAWAGIELARAYLLTGYAASSLAHSQALAPVVIQLADQVGIYGIGFIMMAASVGIYRIVESSRLRRSPLARVPATSNATTIEATESRWPDVVIATLLVGVLFAYGVIRLQQGDRLASESEPMLRVELIQENTPSMFDLNEGSSERLRNAWFSYADMTARALTEHDDVDLIVWPESTYTSMVPWMDDRTTDAVPPELAAQGFDRHSVLAMTSSYQREFDTKTQTLHDLLLKTPAFKASSGQAVAKELPAMLLGNDAWTIEDTRVARYNSALLLDGKGQIKSRYDKIHLVMFGEYIPLAWALSFLGDAFGFSSATAGTEPTSFEIAGHRIAPSICFESMLPQFMAWQFRTLAAKNETPDLLVTITNDSWFRGSSILDHHLACEILVAVELRRPLLVAANTGLSAWVAGSGRVLNVTPRLKPIYIHATPTKDSRWGMTQVWADAPGWFAASICILGLGSSLRGRYAKRRRSATKAKESEEV